MRLGDKHARTLLDTALSDISRHGRILDDCHGKILWGYKKYTRKDLEKLCHLTVNMTSEEIKKRIRATTFKDFRNAYIIIDGTKFSIAEKE